MIYSKKLLILIDTMSVACSFAPVLTFAIAFALCAEVVAEHGSQDKILFGGKLVQRTGDDEPDGLQTFASSEVNIQVLSSSWLQQVWDSLTLQTLDGDVAVLLITCEQHHVAHALIQLVDVVHQHFECLSLLNLYWDSCRRSHFFLVFVSGCKDTAKKKVRNT